MSYVIGQSNYFGFGFTTLKRKPLYEGLFWLISFIFVNIRAELYRQENDATMAIVNYSQVNLTSRPLCLIVYLIFLLY